MWAEAKFEFYVIALAVELDNENFVWWYEICIAWQVSNRNWFLSLATELGMLLLPNSLVEQPPRGALQLVLGSSLMTQAFVKVLEYRLLCWIQRLSFRGRVADQGVSPISFDGLSMGRPSASFVRYARLRGWSFYLPNFACSFKSPSWNRLGGSSETFTKLFCSCLSGNSWTVSLGLATAVDDTHVRSILAPVFQIS